MNAIVLLVGEGLLVDFVYRELAALDKHKIIYQSDFSTGIPAEADLVLVLQDGWYPLIHRHAEDLLKSAGIPWIRGFVSFGEGVLGPLVRPNKPGCSRCADMRRLMAGHDRKETWTLQEWLTAHGGIDRDRWASRTGLLQMAYLVATEAQRVLEGNEPFTDQRMFLIHLTTLRISRHFFLPEPQCPVCGGLPDDSSESSIILLKPRPKLHTDSYRTRPLDAFNSVLVQDYLDFRTGFINGKMQDLVSPFATVAMTLPLTTGNEVTAGRTHSFADSELTAIFEGIERHGGLAPHGKRTVIYDSFFNLQDKALNPVTVGVHGKDQYARPDFPFKKFDPERLIHWVWGYSFLRERPILVPELLAYYSMGYENGFVYETSNGCALGGSLEEAIFYGILEVAERDSFLMTWYAQLRLPRLDPYSANDRELQLMIDYLQSVVGYDLYLFNATTENMIPSIYVIARSRMKTGINLLCSAGTHLDPVRAAKAAIHEVAGMLLSSKHLLEANQEKYMRMLDDPFQVKAMEDHYMLYGLPQAEERLQFLLDDSRPTLTFDEDFKWRSKHADLTDDLKDIIRVFLDLNLDVIVVNQTSPEMERSDLHCVKVLIPGMLPMTFGHHLTRLEGLERVLRIPAELGYTPRPLTFEQLNPHPHPFP